MANPQLEDGYLMIARPIMEALCRIQIPGNARRCLDFILLKTFGWGKKRDRISLSQFVLGTALSKAHICRALNHLEGMGLIARNGNKRMPEYTFIKDFDRWNALPKSATLPKLATGVTKTGKKSLPKSQHTKDTKIQKKSFTKNLPSPEALRLSGLLADLILKNNPTHRRLSNGGRDKAVASWALNIDRLIRLDRQPTEKIERVIRWCQTDAFWRLNILSGSKLRDQFDQLVLKMEASRGGKPQGAGSSGESGKYAGLGRKARVSS